MEELVSFTKQFSTVLFFSAFVFVFLTTYILGSKSRIESIKYSIFDSDELEKINK